MKRTERWATISMCGPPEWTAVEFHPTKSKAGKAIDHMDRLGCCHLCTKQHHLVKVRVAEARKLKKIEGAELWKQCLRLLDNHQMRR